MDIVTMAMNLYSQGIDPELDLSGHGCHRRHRGACTQIALHPRHPYAGELVYTGVFRQPPGRHPQVLSRQKNPDHYWDVAYLPIDPADLGRSYEAVIRINSQSGKGRVTYLLERDLGLQLPRWLQIDFSRRAAGRG